MTGLHPGLAVTVLAEGDSPEIILLHGFTGDSTTWQAFAEAYPSGRRVLAVDLPGHGLSPDAPSEAGWSIPATALAVLDAIAPWAERAHWVGYSMGGRVALAVALARPEVVLSLTLVGASPGIDPPDSRAARRQHDDELASYLETEGLEAFVDRWMAMPIFASQARLGPEHAERSKAQRLRNRVRSLAASLRRAGTGSMEPMSTELERLMVPVQWMAGSLDTKYAEVAAEMAQRMPNARALSVLGVGHALHLEAPDALAAAVANLVAEVEMSRIAPERGRA